MAQDSLFCAGHSSNSELGIGATPDAPPLGAIPQSSEAAFVTVGDNAALYSVECEAFNDAARVKHTRKTTCLANWVDAFDLNVTVQASTYVKVSTSQKFPHTMIWCTIQKV